MSDLLSYVLIDFLLLSRLGRLVASGLFVLFGVYAYTEGYVLISVLQGCLALLSLASAVGWIFPIQSGEKK